MKRRTHVVGAALSAASVAFGIAATAAGAQPKAPFKTTCATNIGIMVASGETGVLPPTDKGTEYGPVNCGKLLGIGIQGDGYTVPDSGDILAAFKMYFGAGSIHGTYDLTPQEGSFTDTNFNEVDSTGVMKILGGTGVFKGARGTGTMTCASLDGIHTSCTDKLRLRSL